ncbi:WD repeat-containing protein 11, partial [Tachysurus ichikawai]
KCTFTASRCAFPSAQVIPCGQRDALYCLHENGCVTLRVCRSTALSVEETGERFFPLYSFSPLDLGFNTYL